MRDTFTVPKSGLMAFKIVRCPFRSPVCEGPSTASSRSGRGPAGANLELGTQTQRLSSDLSIVISISGYLVIWATNHTTHSKPITPTKLFSAKQVTFLRCWIVLKLNCEHSILSAEYKVETQQTMAN